MKDAILDLAYWFSQLGSIFLMLWIAFETQNLWYKSLMTTCVMMTFCNLIKHEVKEALR